MSALESRFLFDLSADVDRALDLRDGDGRGRFIIPVLGGTFEGPRLKGTIRPVGADFLYAQDGYSRLDVRLVLETSDNALIYMTYLGISTIGGSVRDRLAAGEEVDPSAYYFRTAPLFETSAADYDWLNRVVAVGVGVRRPTTVDYRVFEIL